MGYETVVNANLSKMQMIQKIDGYISGELRGQMGSLEQSCPISESKVGDVNVQKLKSDVKSSVQQMKSVE